MDIYHEKQKLALCALHSVNNILQKQAYTKQEFDKIADEWDDKWKLWSNHRSVLGHYDINVIEKALSLKGKNIKWFDMRRPIEGIGEENFDALLVNSKESWGYVPFVKTNHWSSFVKKSDEKFWFLDSKRGKPIGPFDKENLGKFEVLKSKNVTQILLVSGSD